MKLIVFLLLLSFSTFATNIKLATLVPKGTNWAKTLTSMSKDISKATDGKVKFKIYYGGVQGDEPDVLRKSKIGQLHGGIFTGKTLGDIFSDIRAIEIPFNYYHDEQKALLAVSQNRDYFNQHLKEQGYINLGFYGIGKVYVVSTKKITTINEMKGLKMWAWEGDPLIAAMMNSLGLVSVPLTLPDVLSSLSTGMIDAAYAPPLAILALQWQSKIKYVIDFPTAYSIGAFLVSEKQWKKIKPENQAKVLEISKKYIEEANKLAKADNNQAIAQLKKLGVSFIEFDKNDLNKAEIIREDVIKKLHGSVLSSKIIGEINKTR